MLGPSHRVLSRAGIDPGTDVREDPTPSVGAAVHCTSRDTAVFAPVAPYEVVLTLRGGHHDVSIVLRATRLTSLSIIVAVASLDPHSGLYIIGLSFLSQINSVFLRNSYCLVKGYPR